MSRRDWRQLPLFVYNRSMVHWIVSELFGWPRWRKAESLEDICELIVRWIETKDSTLPWHLSGPDPETALIRNELVMLNCQGLLTFQSQPGLANFRGEQRAWVELFIDRDRAEALIEACSQAGLTVLGLGHSSLEPIPITRNGSRIYTTAPGPPSIREFPRGSRKILGNSTPLTVIDPVWGRSEFLWATLKAFVEQNASASR